MSDQTFKVGDVVENEIRQFAKIISFRNGVYGFSGWTTRENALKATIVNKFINIYGVASANLKLVKGAKVNAPASTESTDNKPTKSSLSKLPVVEIKKLAEELGLSIEGTKPEILERLFAHFEI